MGADAPVWLADPACADVPAWEVSEPEAASELAAAEDDALDCTFVPVTCLGGLPPVQK